MIVSIHQPAYLPWLGYFDKIVRSDVFVYLDTVQFQKGSFQNRNKIRTKDGSIWLTVPVKTRGRIEQPIKEVEINNDFKWQHKHRFAIEMNYHKAPFYGNVRAMLNGVYYQYRTWPLLNELCYDMLLRFFDLMHISDNKLYTSSYIGADKFDGKKSDLVLAICKHFKATKYLSGSQGKNYIDEKSFNHAGIEVEYQDYKHPVYKQVYPVFVPNMGIVDFLSNCGVYDDCKI